MSNALRSSSAPLVLALASALFAGSPCPSVAADRLQEIRQRGVLLWGADAEGGAPYVYPDPQRPEQLIGFEFELAEALARRLGVKAQMAQAFQYRFGVRLAGLDILAANDAAE